MMIWQLLQVRHLKQTPLILVGKLWPGLIEWVRDSMLSFETPLINTEDVDIPICVANADEAIAIIQRHRQVCGFSGSSH
jgi:predicted Rossmann-fold nucleotide-binding protein